MQRFFHLGDSGTEIKAVQDRLKDLGFLKGKTSENFDDNLLVSLKDFQNASKLNVDGVVGPKTWRALGLSEPAIPSVVPVPVGLEEIRRVFGDPLEVGFWEDAAGWCETPPELNHVFTFEVGGKRGFYCHKFIVNALQSVYRGIVRAGLANELKTFSGCYNLRYKRGMRELSTHSWGIAVDHNAETNRMGTRGTMHAGVIQIFQNNGFTWGGTWKNRPDPMHFNYCKGY